MLRPARGCDEIIHSPARYSFPMRRLLLNFQNNKGWWCHFIHDDPKTSVGGKWFMVNDPPTLRGLVIKLGCEDIEDFDRCVRAWARGSVHVHLSDEQCRFFGIR